MKTGRARALSRVSIIGEKIRRERGEVISPRVGVPLASRPVEFEDDNRAAPRLGSRAGGYAVNRAINRGAPLQRSRAIPNVEREP